MRIQCKLITLFAAAAILLGGTQAAHSKRGQVGRDGDLGVGLMFGAPTGISAKYYFNRLAIDAGLGVFRGYPTHEGTHVHADVLWHPSVIADTRHFALPFHVGVGGRLLSHNWANRYDNGRLYFSRSDTHVGVRVPAGLTMNFKRIPIDVFFELALVADLIVGGDQVCRDSQGRLYDCDWNHGFLDVNGALGARYYF